MHPWHCVFELGQKLWNPGRRLNHFSDVWGYKNGHNVLVQGPYRSKAWAVSRERCSGSRTEKRIGLLSNSTLSARTSCFSIKVQILTSDTIWTDLASPSVPWCLLTSVIGKLLQLKLRHPESSGVSVLRSPSIPNSQDQKFPVKTLELFHSLILWLLHMWSLVQWVLSSSAEPSPQWWRDFLAEVFSIDSKARFSSWSWLSGPQVSLGADLGRELADCIPKLPCTAGVVYGDVLVFISLGLTWPVLRTPSPSKKGLEWRFTSNPAFPWEMFEVTMALGPGIQ